MVHLFSININGKQGVNSLMCASRASNGVYSLVFTTVSVGLHAHQHPVIQDSRTKFLSWCKVFRNRLLSRITKELNMLV